MNLYTSVFAYVCSIGLYNGIVNADTHNARIANADGQGEGVRLKTQAKYSNSSGLTATSSWAKRRSKEEITKNETNTLHTRNSPVNPRLHRRDRQE